MKKELFFRRYMIFSALLALSLFLGLSVSCTGRKSEQRMQIRQQTYIRNIQREPSTLHPIRGTDMYNQEVNEYFVETLLIRDWDTYELHPWLAEEFSISEDNKTFTFTLREGVTFSDGQPLTIEDVKFSFDMIFDDAQGAFHLRPFYEHLESVEVLDERTLKLVMNEVYFRNFDTMALTAILPKHIYGDDEADRDSLSRTVIGTGPYRIARYDQGQGITLERRDDYWGNALSRVEEMFLFPRVRLRFVSEENVAVEMLKKGEIDFERFTPEVYSRRAQGPEFGQSVHKYRVKNRGPKNYQYIGLNLQRPLFQDRRVRKALAYLVNREEMNKNFRDGLSQLATGPWHLASEYADPDVKPILYDPEKAAELLKDAGWTVSKKDGILRTVIEDREVPFRFTLLYGNADFEKYYVFIQGDMRELGIRMDLQLVDWTMLLQVIDEKNFDAIALGWGGGSIDVDPKQIWHTDSAVSGGSNFISYSNKEVDKLIEKARKMTERDERIRVLRQVYRMISEDVPYLFLYTDAYEYFGLSDRIGMKSPTKEYGVRHEFWWIK